MSSFSDSDKKSNVVIATHNPHKFTELKSTLSDLPFEFLPLTNWSQKPAAETGKTFVENAVIKARYASQRARVPAIADDSGLIVDLLNGKPGVHSSRFAGEQATDEENNNLLLERVKAKRKFNEPVKASFVAILVYLEHADDATPIIAEGSWQGSIIESPRGNCGFGYDPLFLPLDSDLTAAELGPSIKNRDSHRAKAARNLVLLLSDRLLGRSNTTPGIIQSATQEVNTPS